MGSRYGRNQKRRHRARIAELEKTQEAFIRNERKLSGQFEQAKFALRTLIKEIDRVAPLSALLKPKVRKIHPDTFRFAPLEEVEHIRENWGAFTLDSMPKTPITLTRVHRELFSITGHIEECVRTFRTVIHLIAQSPTDKRHAVYYVSKGALNQSRFLSEVYEEITVRLISNLMEARAKR